MDIPLKMNDLGVHPCKETPEYFLFSSLFGEMIQVDQYLRDGLVQPPTTFPKFLPGVLHLYDFLVTKNNMGSENPTGPPRPLESSPPGGVMAGS